MTNTGVAVVGLLAAAAIASAQTAAVLTIDDAVTLALRGNREVQPAALDVYRAREQSVALKTTRLPQFQIYALGASARTAGGESLENESHCSGSSSAA